MNFFNLYFQILILVIFAKYQILYASQSTKESSIKTTTTIDPYNNARQFYHGEHLKEYELIKEVLERLDPRKNTEKWKITESREPFYDPNASW